MTVKKTRRDEAVGVVRGRSVKRWLGKGLEIQERVHSHHLGVGERRRGFSHGRDGQSMGMVLELGRGGVDNVVYININLYHNHDSCM